MKPHLLALGCLALVTLVYAWPLVERMTTAVPGVSEFRDIAVYIWNVGWVHYALTRGTDLFRSDALLVPFGIDLRLHTYFLLQAFVAYPFVAWLGVVGAHNLMLVATIFLNGWMAYLLVYREAQEPLAALIAAVALMLGSPVLGQLTGGRSGIGALWIVCGALLMTATLLDRPQLRKGIALGIWLAAGLLSDFHIVLFSALWLALYFAYRVWSDRSALLTRAHLTSLGIAGLIFAIPFLLVYYPALAGSSSAGYPQPSLEEAIPYSFRYWDYVTPGVMAYAYGYDFLIAAIGAVLLLRRPGAHVFWLIAALFFLILALGPYLQPTQIPLPFAALSLWSPLRQFRTPSRLTMAALIGFAVVTGLVLTQLLSRLRLGSFALPVTALLIGSRLLFALNHDPLRVQTYPDYAVYHQLANEPGDFTLLEVPFNVRSGFQEIGTRGDILMYYQHVHHKRLLNGAIARVPRAVFEFYRTHPALLFLSDQATRVNPDEAQTDLNKILSWSNARYVLVHRSLLSAPRADEIEKFLDAQPQLRRAGVEGDLVIYRVRP